VYPGVEHRFCIRHLHANFKSNGWKGRAFKDELFGVARATIEARFNHHMNVIKAMDEEAFKYLEKLILVVGQGMHLEPIVKVI
jgi:hypothetical protein